MPGPNDPGGTSPVQREVNERRRCYRERIVRRQVVRHGADGARKDWEEEAGWTDAKGEPTVKKKWFDARWKNPWETEDLSGYTAFGFAELIKGVQIELSYTACDVLDFQTPALAPCEKLTEHPVAPAATDGNIFQAIARLDLAIADPGRQAELFGWTTPNAADLPAVVAFEKAKTNYWNLVCDSAFKHLEILKETADFKAANLLRVLYLAGETPPHIAGASPIWRQPAALGRDVNFSAAVQVRIELLLLEFKYWGDDPFYVDGGFNAADKDNIRAHRTTAIEEERRQEAMHKTVEGRPLTPEEIENEVKADIGDKKLNYEMTFWSENHQLLFASAEFLAGQWMPDKVFRAGLRHRGEGPEGSRPGDLTGEQRMRQAKKRLIRWLDDRLRLGFSEWNAPGYYAEDLEPLFNLVDFCQDQDIRGRALMVLDLMIFDLARFSLRGSFGVTAGRCYYSQKMCGYDQSVGDLIEIFFGTRDGVIVWDGGEFSGAFASSRGYTVPDVLVKVGQDRPVRMVDRSRVSLRFDEASIYDTGFATDLDTLFWWSRGAYFTKQVVRITRIFTEYFHLNDSPPFRDLLPMFKIIVKAAQAVTYAIDVPSAALIDLFTDTPDEVDVADELSPLTEGSALTRANLYTYRNRDAMLSSVQNWRRGQFNLQSHVCQATLGPCATVWTTHPSAGGSIDLGSLGGMSAVSIELIEHSDDGPNWWTGTVTLPRVVQRDGSAILAYQPGELMRRLFGERTHAWFPQQAFEPGSIVQTGAECNVDDASWTFGNLGDGYVGLFSARPIAWTTAGPWARKELLAEAGRNVFIIQVGNRDEFGSYENFKTKVSGARIHVNGLRNMFADFECSYDMPAPGGGRLELHYDDEKVVFNGVAFSDDAFPRFENPYMKCGRAAWGQYHYTIAFGEHSLTHDFRELRTKTEGATVHRFIESQEHDCEEDRFWVVSDRGARRVFPENTLEAAAHAVVQEGAMGLLVDACLTADGEVALWHDWDPDELTAVLRQLGGWDVAAYRPAVPDAGDPLRREVIDLTLAQLRFTRGYEAVGTKPGEAPAPFVIPTLGELVKAAREWPALRHLLINIRMPAERAADHAGEMLACILELIGRALPLDVTLLTADEEVLTTMKAYAADMAPPGQIAFSYVSMVGAIPRDANGAVDFAARDAVLREQSALEGAIRNETPVALLGRVPTANQSPFDDYYQFVAHDVGGLEPYNLNPRANKGHPVDRLLTAVRDDATSMRLLLDTGVSGIITDDVPGLRGVLAKAGRA